MGLSDLPTLADAKPIVTQKCDITSRHDVAKDKKATRDAAWVTVCKAVDARDGRQCRCCDKRSNPEATGLLDRGHRHHIVYRSAGGQDDASNLVTLCAGCHNDEHHNRLRIDGPTSPVDANGPLWFMRKGVDGVFYVVREEIAVRVVRRD